MAAQPQSVRQADENKKMNIGVLASHEGTTLQSLIDACADGRVNARVAVVISNNSNSGALLRARRAGIDAVHLSLTTHGSAERLDAAIRDTLLRAKIDVVLLAGFMKKVGPFVLARFGGRVLNTHPSLLPKFGGKGMFGDRVFEAVLEANEQTTGVSVHLVDPNYDAGEVLRQSPVHVLPGDSVSTLKARVQVREKELVVETLAEIAKGKIALCTQAGDDLFAK